jgi:hypothetical protein
MKRDDDNTEALRIIEVLSPSLLECMRFTKCVIQGHDKAIGTMMNLKSVGTQG